MFCECGSSFLKIKTDHKLKASTLSSIRGTGWTNETSRLPMTRGLGVGPVISWDWIENLGEFVRLFVCFHIIQESLELIK